MLQSLGRRLTLLNMVISGAILLVMALVALGVAERTIETQYENDMRVYQASLLSAFAEPGGDVHILVKIPEKYYVYVEDEEMRTRVMTDSPLSEETVDGVATDVRVAVEAQAASAPSMDVVNLAKGDNALFFRSTIRNETEGDAQSAAAPSLATTVSVFSYTAQGAYLYELDGTAYRVLPTLFGRGEDADMMLVFQDRTDELASRDRLRWMFALCVAGGMCLIVMASLYLSAKAIAPVDQSIKKQREFVAAASHELRTPVAALRANAEVLTDAKLDEYAPYLGAILDESDRMTRLVSDLLGLARADAGELAVESTLIDAVEVIEDVHALMLPLAKAHTLKLEQRSPSALMMGDTQRLRQILVALIDNAIRYTPDGGEIALCVDKRQGRVVIGVEDNGLGLDDAHKARIFERFYRVDSARSRRHGGAGLGLSVVKQLTDMMKGSVRVYDRDGGGCVFELSFQAIEKPGARRHG